MAEVTEHSMYKKWDSTQLLNSIERHKPLRLCNQEDACWRHYAKRNKSDISNYTINNSIEWISGKCKTTVTESIYICKWLRMGVASWLQRGTGYLLGWWKCSISFIILILVTWLYVFVRTCYYTLKNFAFYYIWIISHKARAEKSYAINREKKYKIPILASSFMHFQGWNTLGEIIIYIIVTFS